MKTILLNPDSTSGGSTAAPSKETPQQTIARLQSKADELQRQLDSYQARDAQQTEDEKVIVDKMSKGLSRDQARSVIDRQRKFEASKPSAAKK